MATKKQPVKPARSNGGKAVKGAKPAPKASAKKAAPKKAPSKPAPKPAAKAAPKKAVATPKKTAKPAKVAAKKTVPAKAPAKAVSKKPAPAPKKAAVPAKAVAKKSAPVKQVAAKPAPKAAPKPAAKPAVAEKKPAPAPQVSKPAPPPPPPYVKKEAKKPQPPRKIVIPKTSTTKAVKYEPDFTKSVLDSQQKASTGPTMRYSDSELVEFRELITRKLETAKKELAYLQGLITRKDEGGDMEDGRYMTMEDGSMSMEREQLSQMASRQIQFIDHLEKAMMRIENKTYGVCRVTGKLIDKARLRAVPHATLSIEAKQMMNK